MKQLLGSKKALAVFLLPALGVYLAVVVVPVCWSFAYSLFTGSPAAGFKYVGLKNFRAMLSDPTITQTFWLTIKYALAMSAGQIVIGYALALFYKFVLRRWSTVVRTLVFFPVVLPTVAVALLFAQLFAISPQLGPIDSIVHALGGQPVDWFAKGSSAFVVIICMDLWRSVGLFAVILYVGLLDIPEEIIESARLDGAGGRSLLRRIILPMSRPIVMAAVIFALNADLKVFDSILALNGGGPGTDTTPLNLYMFQTSFEYNDWGYGAAIAVLITVLSLTVTLLVFRSLRRDLTKA
ncbi:MAG TPA: sugar ABC transporter permease [Acidimicrobiales bacterium]|nr:sugar ABC transporter permease [Acidimicrobiales bacterium]